jgi:AcrR family transcriptional regulator
MIWEADTMVRATMRTTQEGDTTLRKGEMTRERILERAADLASLYGLEDITIGRLAADLGMSKSGLYAHFGSKEELQLATIATARARYQRTTVNPALEAPRGLAQIEKTMEYLLTYLEKRIFPGGCFFNSVNAEFHARPGAIRDNIREGKARWRARIAKMARDAQRNGEFHENLDPSLFAFELDAFINFANWSVDDSETLALTRRAVRASIQRAKA